MVISLPRRRQHPELPHELLQQFVAFVSALCALEDASSKQAFSHDVSPLAQPSLHVMIAMQAASFAHVSVIEQQSLWTHDAHAVEVKLKPHVVAGGLDWHCATHKRTPLQSDTDSHGSDRDVLTMDPALFLHCAVISVSVHSMSSHASV
jgi:hypothetical protein